STSSAAAASAAMPRRRRRRRPVSRTPTTSPMGSRGRWMRAAIAALHPVGRRGDCHGGSVEAQAAMDELAHLDPPIALRAILDRSAAFAMPSEPRTGAMLRMLAATKPGGRLLELGTGTGLATAWLLDGMDRDARLISVDVDPIWQ